MAACDFRYRRRSDRASRQNPENVYGGAWVRVTNAAADRRPIIRAVYRTIESDLLKRLLSDQEENNVAELCSGLLSMALGDEKIVIRLVRLEWTESTDVVDAF